MKENKMIKDAMISKEELAVKTILTLQWNNHYLVESGKINLVDFNKQYKENNKLIRTIKNQLIAIDGWTENQAKKIDIEKEVVGYNPKTGKLLREVFEYDSKTEKGHTEVQDW